MKFTLIAALLIVFFDDAFAQTAQPEPQNPLYDFELTRVYSGDTFEGYVTMPSQKPFKDWEKVLVKCKLAFVNTYDEGSMSVLNSQKGTSAKNMLVKHLTEKPFKIEYMGKNKVTGWLVVVRFENGMTMANYLAANGLVNTKK